MLKMKLKAQNETVEDGHSTISLLNQLRRNTRELKFTDLLIKTESASCLDPRHKIYGLVGLSADWIGVSNEL
jgi:hypothetical protein